MDHNSRRFHEDFGKISPEGEYANQLQTAVLAVRKFGGTPQMAAQAYGVRIEDIVRELKASTNDVRRPG